MMDWVYSLSLGGIKLLPRIRGYKGTMELVTSQAVYSLMHE